MLQIIFIIEKYLKMTCLHGDFFLIPQIKFCHAQQ